MDAGTTNGKEDAQNNLGMRSKSLICGALGKSLGMPRKRRSSELRPCDGS